MGVKRAQVGSYVCFKSAELNSVMGWKLRFLSIGEESGIPRVAVKCVDMGRNTSGEGGFLDDV